MINLRVLVFFSVAYFCCCHGGMSQSISSQFPNEERVRSFIKEGMERETVIREFGNPHDTRTNGIWVDDSYISLSSKTVVLENKFLGFDVTYTNYRVLRWDPVYSGGLISGNPSHIIDSATNSTSTTNEIEFYIVRDIWPNGVYIDTPDFPRLGYIRKNADAVFTKMKSAELRVEDASSSGGGNRYDIKISLMEEDAKRFETMTSQNVTKQILVMINHTPIAAPIVTQPINDGEMLIRLRDKKKAEEAISILKKLAK